MNTPQQIERVRSQANAAARALIAQLTSEAQSELLLATLASIYIQGYSAAVKYLLDKGD